MTIRDDKIVSYIINNAGVTLDVTTMETVDYNKGYSIGTNIDCKVVSINDFNKSVVDKFIEKNAHYLVKKTFNLGAWVYDGNVYLDIVTYRRYKCDAKKLGKIYEQDAIYDFENKDVIELWKL